MAEVDSSKRKGCWCVFFSSVISTCLRSLMSVCSSQFILDRPHACVNFTRADRCHLDGETNLYLTEVSRDSLGHRQKWAVSCLSEEYHLSPGGAPGPVGSTL